MSRVFEALTKATQERAGGVEAEETALKPAADARRTHGGGLTELADVEVFNARNGKPTQMPAPVAGKAAVSKSWREKLEELFFGWDLRRYSTHPIIAIQEESPAAEQYKILREQLKRLREESGIRTIAVTSPVKKEGKTMVAVNLAAAIALEYEERVLLIDADFRSPSVHRYFGVDGSPGLTDYLGSDAQYSIKSVVRDTHLSGLQIIPAGKPSRLAAELLAKEKMRWLIEEIHAGLPDRTVIIDSPPALATPDPLILSRHADGIIMVVRAGRTPRDCLGKALGAFDPSKILGVVLNGADLGLASKYYYYYSQDGRG